MLKEKHETIEANAIPVNVLGPCDKCLTATREFASASREPLVRALSKIMFLGILFLAGVLLLSYMFADKALAPLIQPGAARLSLYLVIALGLSSCYVRREVRRWRQETSEEAYEQHPAQMRNAMDVASPSDVLHACSPNADDEWEKTAVVMAHP